MPIRCPPKSLTSRGGLGFSDDPDAFLLSAELPFRIHEGFSLAPLVQFGLDDDFLFVAPSLDVRYTVDLSRSNSDLVKRLRPFAQAGAGLMYINVDDRPRDDVFRENFIFSWEVARIGYAF